MNFHFFIFPSNSFKLETFAYKPWSYTTSKGYRKALKETGGSLMSESACKRTKHAFKNKLHSSADQSTF